MITEEKALDIFEKYKSGFHYIPCDLCGSTSHKIISQRDKYGLPCNVVICKCCGLSFFNPCWNKDTYNNFYKQDYRVITGTDSEIDEYHFLEKKSFSHYLIDNFFVQLDAEVPSNWKVLDVGCHIGAIMDAFSERLGCEVIGIEPGEKASEFAREKGLNVITGTLENVYLKENDFDLILLLRTMNHLSTPSSSLGKLRSLLKPSGKLWIDVDDVVQASSRFRFYSQVDHPYMYSYLTFKNMLVVNGLKPIMAKRDLQKPYKYHFFSVKDRPQKPSYPELRRTYLRVMKTLWINQIKNSLHQIIH